VFAAGIGVITRGLRLRAGRFGIGRGRRQTPNDAFRSRIKFSARATKVNGVLGDETGGVIAGHGRVLAARQLGMTRVPRIVLTGLSESQRRAYMIADNKLALNAGWDPDLLRLELGELNLAGFDLSLTGFGNLELGSLLDEPHFAPGSDGDQQRLDEKKKIHCPNCHHEFHAP
jgi:ParB family transcriptional regulator, chromosome partitioning protein